MTTCKLHANNHGLCIKCHQERYLNRAKGTICEACYKTTRVERVCKSPWTGTLRMGKRLTAEQKALARHDVGGEPLRLIGLRV